MISHVKVNVHLSNLLQFLVSKLFVEDSYCTVLYYDQSLSSKQNQLVHVVERELLLHQIATIWIAAESNDVEDQLENAIAIGCQSYITLTDDLMRFFDMKLVIKDRTEQRVRDKNFLIFFDNVTTLTEGSVFQEAMNVYPNIWIVSPSREEEYQLFTQNYSRADLVELYSLNVSELRNSSIFSDKLFDLGGRDVKVGVLDYGPYCLTKNVGENRGNADSLNSTLQRELQIEGTEGNLILEFCKLRKCNLKLLPHGPNNWGYIDENGNGDGMLYATYSKRTELSICCVSYTWVCDQLDGSHLVASTAMKILVPRAKVLPTYLTTVYPFENKLWVAMFVTLITLIVVLHGVSTLNFLRVSKAQPALLKSIVDMISIYLNQQVYLKYAKLDDLQAVVQTIEVIPDLEQLYQRTLRGDIGVAVELLNSQKIYPGPYIREDNVNLFELLRETIYSDYTAGVSQRGWPLMQYLNKFILEVVQGGFVIHWEREMLRKFQSSRLDLAMERIVAGRKVDLGLQVLDVEHILGPLYILLIGSAMAIVVFLLEVFWLRLRDKLLKSLYVKKASNKQIATAQKQGPERRT